LKLEGGPLEEEGRFAAFSASCFANRKAALRFVLGAIEGPMILLGRGLGLPLTPPAVEVAGDAVPLPLAGPRDGDRVAVTEAGRDRYCGRDEV